MKNNKKEKKWKVQINYTKKNETKKNAGGGRGGRETQLLKTRLQICNNRRAKTSSFNNNNNDRKK